MPIKQVLPCGESDQRQEGNKLIPVKMGYESMGFASILDLKSPQVLHTVSKRLFAQGDRPDFGVFHPQPCVVILICINCYTFNDRSMNLHKGVANNNIGIFPDFQTSFLICYTKRASWIKCSKCYSFS